MSRHRAERYASWLDANRVGILVLAVLVAVLGGYLASRMTIKSDYTSLLPATQRSVRDLNAVQKRARPFGTVQIVLESDDLKLRARAAEVMARRLAELPAELVVQVSADDGPMYRYVWAHRFLVAELADLEAARDALKARIEHAKLVANPLYVDLDDDAERDKLAALEDKLAEAEAKAESPPPRVSPDGRLQLLIIQTTFPASSHLQARQLISRVYLAISEVRREVGPGVRYGLTGNVTSGMHEHDSVLQGMWLSAVITVVLCAFGLLLYYRSGRVVLAMLFALAVGVAATFAIAWAGIGHLNVMTAFLAAIVIGNGINAGLILVARFQEEVRGGLDPRHALAPAIAGALRGTLAATATAAVAYASLMITDFTGFRQFGAIAGAGMLLTWLTTFTVLPAILFVLARRGRIKLTKPPAIGIILARLMPHRRFGLVVAVGAAVTLIAAAITVDYIVHDPFTHDWRDLQSSTTEIRQGRALDAKIRAAFDPKSILSAQAYLAVIAAPRRDQVGPLVTALRADDAGRPPERRWLHDVRSIEDLLPRDQPATLAVLAEIRRLIDDPDLQAALSDDERAKLAKVRPPDDLRRLTDTDVPKELAWPFTERDGTVGRLIILRGAKRFNSFNVDHRLEFAAEVRRLDLPPGAQVASESLIVADIIETMERDAPNMIAFALAGSVLAVFFVIGLRRHGAVTLACGLAGVILMVALCAIAGLKVHFLDLIALPITIGIGIDYAANLAARDRQDGQRGPHHLLRTTGATVLLCSYTTAIGYSALLLSANGGIRAFGLAALLGEIACIAMALLVAPALLALLRERDVRRHGADAATAT